MPPAHVDRCDQLTPEQIAAVQQLIDRVTASDGVRPLSEHVMLALSHRRRNGVSHLLLHDGIDLIGYASLDEAESGQAINGELAAIDAAAARALVGAIEAGTASGVRVWARGEGSTIRGVLSELGYRADRVLLQMRRPLAEPLAEPSWPPGVAVRPFVVGQDETAWLEVNNAAFADHPDQSGWTLDDVEERERQDWFDPAGFFLAERDGELVGFHWTKVHRTDPAGGVALGAGEPVGEVYVVGVSPTMQGQHLGSALTLVGLIHLRQEALSAVLLYVDESNTSAVHVYERLGFTRWDADICFIR